MAVCEPCYWGGGLLSHIVCHLSPWPALQNPGPTLGCPHILGPFYAASCGSPEGCLPFVEVYRAACPMGLELECLRGVQLAIQDDSPVPVLCSAAGALSVRCEVMVPFTGHHDAPSQHPSQRPLSGAAQARHLRISAQAQALAVPESARPGHGPMRLSFTPGTQAGVYYEEHVHPTQWPPQGSCSMNADLADTSANLELSPAMMQALADALAAAVVANQVCSIPCMSGVLACMRTA